MLKHSLSLILILILIFSVACGGSKASPTTTATAESISALQFTPDTFVPTPPSSLLTRIAKHPTPTAPDQTQAPSASATLTITPTTSPTFPLVTPTPRATPVSSAQPDWTLELEVLTSPRNIPGTLNMLLGINDYCPATGCEGDASIPNPGIPAYGVYLCHPAPGIISCNGERKLTTSYQAPTDVQTWVLEATYPGQMRRIRISWHPQELPDGLILDLFPTGQSGDLIDMTSLAQDFKSYVITMGTAVTTSVLICSRSTGIIRSRCFD